MPRRAIRANRGNRSTFSTEGKLVRMEKMEDKDWQVGQVGIGWRKKNDDGKDLCDVKRYKKKNLTYYIKNDR